MSLNKQQQKFVRNVTKNLFVTSLDCNDPPTPPTNGILVGIDQTPDSAGTYPFDALATYQCSSNFFAQGNTTVLCLTTGLWEELTLICMEGA